MDDGRPECLQIGYRNLKEVCDFAGGKRNLCCLGPIFFINPNFVRTVRYPRLASQIVLNRPATDAAT
jgi:hypothetical protein